MPPILETYLRTSPNYRRILCGMNNREIDETGESKILSSQYAPFFWRFSRLSILIAR